MDLGYIVKERRESLGMSQEDLAFKMGYKNRSSINKIENGRPVTQKIIVRLAEALETTPAFLMGWNKETNSEGEEIALNEYMKSMALKFGQLNEQNQKTIETMVNALLLQQLSEENN